MEPTTTLNQTVSLQMHLAYCPEKASLNFINLREGPEGACSKIIAADKELLERIAKDLPSKPHSIKKKRGLFYMEIENRELSPFKKIVIKKMDSVKPNR